MMDFSSIPPEALKQVMEGAAGRAAHALGEILGCPVEIALDSVRVLTRAQYQALIAEENDRSGATILIKFSGGLSGSAYFLVLGDNVQQIIQILSEQDPDLVEGAGGVGAILAEIGNVVLNGYVGTIVNQMGLHVVYEAPQILARAEAYDTRPLLTGAHALQFQVFTNRLSLAGREIIVYILLSLRQTAA